MQTAFPHILNFPPLITERNKTPEPGLLRAVTPDKLTGGGILKIPLRMMINKSDVEEMRYDCFQIESIEEQRLAIGDWSKWEQHPTYYKMIGKHIGEKFESEL